MQQRPSFRSIDFQLESSQAPKIKAGASSSSNILNRYFEAVSSDISVLASRVNSLSTLAAKLQSSNVSIGTYYSGLFDELKTRVDAASGYNQCLASMHSNSFVDSSTTAEVNNTFGQATLPVTSTTDLILQTDIYGRKQIFNQTELSYVESAASTPPSNGEFTADLNAEYMLKEEEPWMVSKVSATQVFVKLKTPLQFRGLLANVLEIWPIPIGGTSLKGVWYQKSGDGADGVWNSIDISYLPSYDGSAVPKLGPVRIHLPLDPIFQICFLLDITNVSVFGLYKLKLYSKQYSNTGNLVVKNIYNRNITSTILRGKDTSDLSLLPISKVTNTATISLSSTDYNKTPVITAVILKN